jgi:hypothetical protein
MCTQFNRTLCLHMFPANISLGAPGVRRRLRHLRRPCPFCPPPVANAASRRLATPPSFNHRPQPVRRRPRPLLTPLSIFSNFGDHRTLDSKIPPPHHTFFDLSSISDVAVSRTIPISGEVSASPPPETSRPVASTSSPTRSAIFFLAQHESQQMNPRRLISRKSIFHSAFTVFTALAWHNRTCSTPKKKAALTSSSLKNSSYVMKN